MVSGLRGKASMFCRSTSLPPPWPRRARSLTNISVAITFVEADVHAWSYPEDAFDVVMDIFSQFSTPADRARKWAGMRRALKRGGLLIVEGYTPKQLDYGTGGPKQVEHLYTRDMLQRAFGDLADVNIVEEERELQEGPGHSGMSAFIGLTARNLAKSAERWPWQPLQAHLTPCAPPAPARLGIVGGALLSSRWQSRRRPCSRP